MTTTPTRTTEQKLADALKALEQAVHDLKDVAQDIASGEFEADADFYADRAAAALAALKK